MLHFLRALLAAAVLSGAACSVYDSELPYSNSAGDSSTAPHDACVAQIEICNGKDDDCDGVTDEAEAVAKDCAAKVLNVDSVCESSFCVKVGPCYSGFSNCDGLPNNGCESATPCGGSDSQNDQDDAGPGAAK